MKTIACIILLFLPLTLYSQRGNVTIPKNSTITVPNGAQICADKIYANNPGYGTLNLANKTCICPGATIIPVELVILSASVQNGAVVLSWITATETRNYGFEVQRETVQGSWAAIGFVEGHGTTTESQSYLFTDGFPPSSAQLRYRLKQIDLDGSSQYSPVVEVALEVPVPRFALGSFPSPCDDRLTIRLTLSDARTSTIRLYDINGRIVMKIGEEMHLSQGSHTMQVRMSEIRSGLYLLVAEHGVERRIQKVVIRH